MQRWVGLGVIEGSQHNAPSRSSRRALPPRGGGSAPRRDWRTTQLRDGARPARAVSRGRSTRRNGAGAGPGYAWDVARGLAGGLARPRHGGGEASSAERAGPAGQLAVGWPPVGTGGPGPTASPAHRAARIWRTASGSSTVASTRNRPPQRGHANTSSANARRMRAAQLQLRRGDDAASSALGARTPDPPCRP